MIPLSTRMRPDKLQDFVGQEHFLYPGSLLYNAIKNKTFDSAIFHGPSGTGKTTLARIIANEMDSSFTEINASTTGTKELKELIEGARLRFFGLEKRTTYVYIDEFHRWNKLQQDSLLKALEDGVLKFIGSTTENPYFAINNAVLSRVRNVYEFKRLEAPQIKKMLLRALTDTEKGFGNLHIQYDEEALDILADLAGGDGRVSLDTLGFIVDNLDLSKKITKEMVAEAMQRKIGFYSKGDDRYNLLSALQKSIRGSDPDAAIHYFARLVDGGADIQMIGRRLLVIASEDIGMADSRALEIAVAGYQACHFLGYPECDVHLTHVVTYLSLSVKSNALDKAYNKAKKDALETLSLPVPLHLRNAPTKLMKDLDYGKGYQYAHDYEDKITTMTCLPEELLDRVYYEPTQQGVEAKVLARLNQIKDWKKRHR